MAQTTAQTAIENIRIWHSPDNTRVVLDVPKPLTYKVFTLENPKRAVLDVDGVSYQSSLPKLDSNNEHIMSMRQGSPQAGTFRLVFELKKTLKPSAFLLTPNELYGHRLVLDLEEVGADVAADTAARPVPQPEVVANDQQARPYMIAIDAGHGGEDPGAIGYRGTYEKTITLAIAKKLKALIDGDPQLQSRMVRKGDYFIKLHKRRRLARQVNADMFISIHADAFKKSSARGFSVFALSQRGATSAMARALAAKENAADRIGGVSLKDKDDLLAKVLVDLSMTNTISESVNFGGRVLRELGKLGKLHSRRVEQAGFAVLKSPDIPSILVETGFITNPTEERNLRSSSYQQKIANGIYKAIKEYYQQTPYYANAHYSAPAVPSVGSKNTSTSKPAYHKVVRGDSLSKIAQKYGVSMAAIRRANKMKSNTVMLGRKLAIPGAKTVAKSVNKTPAKPLRYKVKRGDSLSVLSARYNVKMSAIRKANNLRGNTLQLGQTLIIPSATSSAPKPKIRMHRVVRGDTLSEIADKYKTTVAAIKRSNKLSGNTVMLGQTLKVPVQ